MSLESAIDEWIEVMRGESSIRSLKDAQSISKQAEAICNSLKNVEEVDSSQARYVLTRIKKIDTEPPLVRKTTFREKILIQRELRSARSLLLKKKYLGRIMNKNWEAFMDADAKIVCEELGIPPPLQEDVLRFKIKLEGHPIPKSWDFTRELTGQKIKNVYLGSINYRGMAKLSQSLLYLDWISTSSKNSDFMLGPPFVHRPPRTIPLSIITRVDAPSQSGHDFDFVVSTPRDIDAATKKEHRSYLDIHTPEKKEFGSYHTLSGFLFKAKVERAEGISKDDQEIMKDRVIERMKQNIPASPIDIGWKLGVFLSFNKRIEFPPINRGVLSPHGEEASSQFIANLVPISEEEYKQGVLDRFEEDGIYHSEETIGKIPVVWSAVHYRMLGQSSLVPIPYGFGAAYSKSDDVNVFCVGILGISDYADKELFNEFKKGADKFAKRISPKNHILDVYPVLMTNSLDPQVRDWAGKIKRGGILELSKGIMHFMRDSILGTQSTEPFFVRYFLSEEMRLVERQDYVEPRVSVKCQNCGATYSYMIIEIESGSANCQNCGTQIEAISVSILPESKNNDSQGYQGVRKR
jgi:hypothetical protein